MSNQKQSQLGLSWSKDSLRMYIWKCFRVSAVSGSNKALCAFGVSCFLPAKFLATSEFSLKIYYWRAPPKKFQKELPSNDSTTWPHLVASLGQSTCHGRPRFCSILRRLKVNALGRSGFATKQELLKFSRSTYKRFTSFSALFQLDTYRCEFWSHSLQMVSKGPGRSFFRVLPMFFQRQDFLHLSSSATSHWSDIVQDTMAFDEKQRASSLGVSLLCKSIALAWLNDDKWEGS